MKTKHIVGVGARSLSGGDPSTVDVVGDEYTFKAYLKTSDSDEPVGVLKIDDGIIIEFDVDEDADVSDVATALMRSACKKADKANIPIIIHPEALVGGIKVIRFMQFFGFSKGKDDYLERRPGAALPFSVIL